MASESGHAPNRAYGSQAGDFHLNGANLFDANENAVAQQIAFTIAQGGSSNITLITMQVKDGAGNNIAAVAPVEWWLTDAATGAALTATTASGAVAAGASGTDLLSKVSKKAGDAITDATGKYILSITDTAKTGFYIAVTCPGTGVTFVSRQLVTADYK